MTTIDFKNIRSTPKSQNHSFEALSVQLFRQACEVPEGTTFVRLRGDGGDGGVEAYFRLPNGSVIAVQAKYFFQLGKKQLPQIDHSLGAALTNYPDLSQYWIYLPFDMTGTVAGGKRGKSEDKRFSEWKEQKEAEAAESGRDLRITLCTASIIEGQLHSVDVHGGYRRYWFDDSVLTETQIQRCLKSAEAFAGPRYTSTLDVVTRAHTGLDFFGGIGDFHTWNEKSLAPVVNELRSLQEWGNTSLDSLGEPAAKKTRHLIGQVIRKCTEHYTDSIPASRIAEIRHDLEDLLPNLSSAREKQEKMFDEKHGMVKDTPNFRQVHAENFCSFPAAHMDAARKWEEHALLLQEILTSGEIGAASSHSLLLVGPPGIGKTHSLVSAANRRLEKGGYSLVVFGEDFGNGDPWEVIRSKFGFGTDIGRETMLESLDTCANHTGLPFVVFVDALNESPLNARWKNKLPEFLAQCKPYAGIKVCVSVRDTYKDLVVEERFPGYAFKHTGFSGHEFEAIQAFANHYGLDSEITPLFTPEYRNPLFLHLACKVSKGEGHKSLDVPLSGFASLLEDHLKHCDLRVRERLQYSNPRNLVRTAMLHLAEVLNQKSDQHRTWDACANSLESVVGRETAPEELLKELEHEGLVILSELNDGEWHVRLGYQRMGDVLRATNLIENAMRDKVIDIPVLANSLSKLPTADEGVLEALAALLPEKTEIELTSIELGLKPELSHRLFVNALAWRSRDSVSADVDPHIYEALHTPDLWQDVFEVFFQLCLVPNHRLNSDNWLGPFFRQSSLVVRDAFLSVAAYRSYDDKGAVWSLIDAALRADLKRWPSESRRMATIALTWLTSCSDRRIRDQASKALVRIIAHEPELAPKLVGEFGDCDDDYILESISLAIYSACLLEHDKQEEFVPALDTLLKNPAFDTPNVLVRDAVRLLATTLQVTRLPETLMKRLEKYPTKAPMPSSWPTASDAKPLLDLDCLPTNMKLLDTGMAPDFWRYEVESKLRNFDLDAASISPENIACWMMVQTLNLGYPGHEECALTADLMIADQFGTGRGRAVYAERLGKKYYWILLHRIIGILADNTSAQTQYTGYIPDSEHLWSVNVRKADLTDLRDISPQREYPDALIQGPRYQFPDKSEDIKPWIRSNDFTPFGQCIVRAVDESEEWIALSLSAHDDDKLPGDRYGKPYRSISLSFSSFLVDGSAEDSVIRRLFNNEISPHLASYYRGYIAEYPDGMVFSQQSEEGLFSSGPEGLEASEVILARGGEWEYDFSYSRKAKSEDLCVPCHDIVKVLSLEWDRQRGWLDSNGKLVAFEAKDNGRHGLLLRRSCLNDYLEITGRQLIYKNYANRLLFTGLSTDNPQVDISTILLYQRSSDPHELKQDSRLFACEDGDVVPSVKACFPFV